MANSGKRIAVYLLLAALALGSAVYYATKNIDGDTPPKFDLSIKGSRFLGKISSDEACHQALPGYKFTASESWVEPSGTAYTLAVGGHFYHSENDLTIEQILNSIRPIDGNKVIIVHYDPATDKWFTYPEIPDPKNRPFSLNSTVYKNNAFMIISCKESEITGIKDERTAADTLPYQIQTVDGNRWILVPQTGDPNVLDQISDKLVSVWYQDNDRVDEDSFKEWTDESGLNQEFKTMWLKLDLAAVAADSVATDDEPAGPASDNNDNDGGTGSGSGGTISLKEQMFYIACLKNPELCNRTREGSSADNGDAASATGSAVSQALAPITDFTLKYDKTEVGYNNKTLVLTSYPTATLTWTDPENDANITSYRVSYVTDKSTAEEQVINNQKMNDLPYSDGRPTDNNNGTKSLTINNLNAGDYWFKIVARYSDGQESKSVAQKFELKDERSEVRLNSSEGWLTGTTIYNTFSAFLPYETDDGNDLELSYAYASIPKDFLESLNLEITFNNKLWGNNKSMPFKKFEDIKSDDYSNNTAEYIDEFVSDYIDVGTDWNGQGGINDIEVQPPFYTVITVHGKDYLILANFHDENNYTVTFTIVDKSDSSLKSKSLVKTFKIDDLISTF
ncbi:fibronectin type III domain-containing protein [Candidatus Peregrinibacteria bacterium]|nr:fibronectin type III domain-containing protein [Candidatus Peregrinibacteria bacterium]